MSCWGRAETFGTDKPTYPSKTVENNEPLGTGTNGGGIGPTRTVLANLKDGTGPQLSDGENLVISELNK